MRTVNVWLPLNNCL